MAAESPDPGSVREALREALGADPGELELEHVPGGASRQTWLAAAGNRRWVLRRDPPGGESFSPLATEVEVIAAAERAAVPVAPVVGFEPAGGPFGSAGFLMEHLDGTSLAPRVLRREELAAAREHLPAQLAEALARIHSLEPAGLHSLAPADADPVLAACEFWERALDDVGEPLPAVEAGLRWLRINAPPPPERQTLVHGDFRLGNFIVDEAGLAAVIDWELCHAGDPAEDIAWLCIRSWRFGNYELPVAGLGGLDRFLADYGRAGGTPPDPERLRWWEALGNVKWAVICARQAHDHLSGRRPSAELASLGRRICEPEWDLLELIAEGA